MNNPNATDIDPNSRVSTIELFFDLVFVFTITQLTILVEHSTGALDLLGAFLVLMLIWWMYAGYTWLTNHAGSQDQMRWVLLAAMAGFLVIALAIPHIFGEHSLGFGLAFLFVVLVHFAAFVRNGGKNAAKAILGVLPINLGASLFSIAAAFAEPHQRWAYYLAGVMLLIGSTLFQRAKGFSINVPHFAERHGGIIIIALGESVVGIGTGAAQRSLDLKTLAAIALSLALISALWWSYFSGDDQRAEHALMAAAPEDRPRIALLGYWYAHLIMIAGIISIAAGVNHAVAHLEEPLGRASGLIGAGVCIFLLGDVFFRGVLKIRRGGLRTWVALGALVAGIFGTHVSGGVALGAAVVALGLMLWVESGAEGKAS